MLFDTVIAQNHVVAALRNAMKQDKVGHAYLFAGPSGVGKRFVAGVFARALNCSAVEFDACGECLSCRKIARFAHPDIYWVVPRGVSASLGIEQMRELQRRIFLKPFEGRYKVFVITSAERLTAEASNALLKVLEEPPPHSVFVLTTFQPYVLFSTVISRCQVLNFFPLPRETIRNYLISNCSLDATEADSLAVLSEGSLGKALEWSDDKALDERWEVLTLVDRISLEDSETIFSAVEQLLAKWENYRRELKEEVKKELEQLDLTRSELKKIEEEKQGFVQQMYRSKLVDFINSLLLWYRDLLLLKEQGEQANILHVMHREDLLKQTEKLTLSGIKRVISILSEGKEWFNYNVNLRLALEVLLISIGEAKAGLANATP